MAFSVSNTGSIIEQFNNSLNEAFGGSTGKPSNKGGNGPELFSKSIFGSSELDRNRWTGNAYTTGRGKLKYGFAIIKGKQLTGRITFSEDSDDVFFLQTAPQSIQQKEIFGTSVQATRKGVIVESEGVVFKDIVISGNTGIYPGERGGSTTPTPSFSSGFGLTQPPNPPSGVDPKTGLSKRSGVSVLSGYEEFLRLRQFFLKYAQRKVEDKGSSFFVWLNQKDNDYFVVEPLEFTMDRDSRSPLTYNYRIVLKAIAKVDAFSELENTDSAVNALDQIANVSANITAAIDSANEVINASTELLVSITQALDNTFLTPVQQLKQALNSVTNGVNTALSLPSVLFRNYSNATDLTLATANAAGEVNTVNNKFATSQTASASQINGSTSSTSEPAVDDEGNVINTGPSTKKSRTSTAQDASTINGKIPNILNDDGTLSSVLTPQQYNAVRDIIDQLENDPQVPLPRSFVEALKTNTSKLRDDLADAVGAGNDAFNEIYGRTVTQIPSPLAVTTTEQFRVLGALQDIISGIDQILSNNDFFQSGAEEIYTAASIAYGDIASIIKPETVREVTVELSDTLEKIALRENGDALRWVDLVIINQLKAPYISTEIDVPPGVLRPGDKILVGNN